MMANRCRTPRIRNSCQFLRVSSRHGKSPPDVLNEEAANAEKEYDTSRESLKNCSRKWCVSDGNAEGHAHVVHEPATPTEGHSPRKDEVGSADAIPVGMVERKGFGAAIVDKHHNDDADPGRFCASRKLTLGRCLWT